MGLHTATRAEPQAQGHAPITGSHTWARPSQFPGQQTLERARSSIRELAEVGAGYKCRFNSSSNQVSFCLAHFRKLHKYIQCSYLNASLYFSI